MEKTLNNLTIEDIEKYIKSINKKDEPTKIKILEVIKNLLLKLKKYSKKFPDIEEEINKLMVLLTFTSSNIIYIQKLNKKKLNEINEIINEVKEFIKIIEDETKNL